LRGQSSRDATLTTHLPQITDVKTVRSNAYPCLHTFVVRRLIEHKETSLLTLKFESE